MSTAGGEAEGRSSGAPEERDASRTAAAGDVQQRARAIGLELCTGAQTTAEQQHEQDKQKALDNWFMEATGDKPGNTRLKNFKR